MKEFKKGQKIGVKSGGQLEIIQKLGEGGQGIVYKVKYNNNEYALKWYFANKLHDADKFYRNIENNIRKGAPTDAFLWPLEITEYLDKSFGYLMKLRPANYEDFSKFLLAKVKFSSISAIINAALCITAGFKVLHNNGFSYQDLNDGNFFVDPKTGDVLICDNDNVAPYGESLGIAGKCRYMAPEVVIGKRKPDAHTDRFSLAVVLYLLFFVNHPLEGTRTIKNPCLTEELERKLYGTDPLFVYDPVNHANAPVEGIHNNELKFWKVYPEFVRKAFQDAFSHEKMVGKDIQDRIMEREWLRIFMNLRGCLAKCPSCGDETFLDLESAESSCICCGNKIPRPPVLKVKKYAAALTGETKIYSCHVIHDSEDYKEVKGEVVPSPNNPDVFGLKNMSGRTWIVTLPNGQNTDIPEGRAVKITKGMKINFGNNNTGEIL